MGDIFDILGDTGPATSAFIMPTDAKSGLPKPDIVTIEYRCACGAKKQSFDRRFHRYAQHPSICLNCFQSPAVVIVDGEPIVPRGTNL